MKDKQIKSVKNWFKHTSIRNIQIFVWFTNFYQCFIQVFSKIAILLILLLKATGLSNLAPKKFRANNNKIVGISSRANEMVINSSKNNTSRKLTCMPNIGATRESIFVALNTKKTFNHLRLAFKKASILWYFDLKSYIQIETDVSGYVIDRVLSQLNLDSNKLPNDLNKSEFS